MITATTTMNAKKITSYGNVLTSERKPVPLSRLTATVAVACPKNPPERSVAEIWAWPPK